MYVFIQKSIPCFHGFLCHFCFITKVLYIPRDSTIDRKRVQKFELNCVEDGKWITRASKIDIEEANWMLGFYVPQTRNLNHDSWSH